MADLGIFRSPFQSRDPSDLLLGDSVNLSVGYNHDGDGNVEADERGGNGVRPVEAGVAVVRQRSPVRRVDLGEARWLSLVPFELHWDEGDEHRQRPSHADHHKGHPGSHLPLVAERAGNGPVSVHADNAEVQDGSCGAHDIESHPNVTESTERPEAGNLCHSLPGHDQDGHQQV